VANNALQQKWVHVSARQDCDGLSLSLGLAAYQRRHCDRASRLDDLLGSFQKHKDRFCDVILGHRYDLVDLFID
jgi:hypothetical protein